MALCVPCVKDEIKEQVGPPFVSGVQELQRFVEVLQNEDIHAEATLVEVEEVALKLRPHVMQAYKAFSTAHNKAAELNGRVSREVEECVAQLEGTQRDIRQIEAEESNLRIGVETSKKEVEEATNQVNDATEGLEAATSTVEQAINELHEKETEQKNLLIIGAAVTPIPIVGWIAGPTMIIVSLTAFQDAVTAAKKNLQVTAAVAQESEVRLNTKTEELNKREAELDSKESKGEQKTNELKKRQDEFKDLKESQTQVLDVSEKLKYLVTFTSTTLGRTKVLKGEFENIYSLDTLQEPLEAIAAHFQSDTLANSQLLLGKLDLASSERKFKIICNKTSTKLQFDVKE